jgi:hypothetical protein
MATLNFIKGTIRGKIGQFVGSSWKGKNYIKTFTKPGNPRTADQVAVRNIFQHVSHIAKALYANVLKPYTFPRPRRQTAYNRMIQINKVMFEAKAWEPEKLKIFDGPLYNPGISACSIDYPGEDREQVGFEWPTLPGDQNDVAIGVLYDEVSGKTLYARDTRDKGVMIIKTETIAPIDKTKAHVYLIFAKPPADGTGEAGQVSGTAYAKVD